MNRTNQFVVGGIALVTVALVVAVSIAFARMDHGDINMDGKVNIKDAAIVSLNWTDKTGKAVQGDINGDGVVDSLDLSIVLDNWTK